MIRHESFAALNDEARTFAATKRRPWKSDIKVAMRCKSGGVKLFAVNEKAELALSASGLPGDQFWKIATLNPYQFARPRDHRHRDSGANPNP